jgi:hypothetical protein
VHRRTVRRAAERLSKGQIHAERSARFDYRVAVQARMSAGPPLASKAQALTQYLKDTIVVHWVPLNAETPSN